MAMRERMQRFMMGRYGNDKMNQVLSVVSMVLVLAGIFLRVNILYTLGLVCLCTFTFEPSLRIFQNGMLRIRRFCSSIIV